MKNEERRIGDSNEQNSSIETKFNKEIQNCSQSEQRSIQWNEFDKTDDNLFLETNNQRWIYFIALLANYY